MHGYAATSTAGRRERVASAAARQPVALMLFAVLLQSAGPVAVQATSVSALTFSFWRLWLGVPLLGLGALLQVRLGGLRWPTFRAWRWAIGAGLAFGCSQLLFFNALKATTVADVSLMTALSPLLVAMVATRLFGERPGPGFRLWTTMAVAGVAIVVLGASTGAQGNPAGMAMAGGAVLLFTVFFLLSKGGREEIAVLPFLFGVMTVGALAISLAVGVLGEPVTTIDDRSFVLALLVAVLPGAIGHLAATWPLRWLPANVPPVLRLAQPILSGLLAWWLLGEAITDAHVVGGLLTLAGVCGAVLTPAGRTFAASARRDPPTPQPGMPPD